MFYFNTFFSRYLHNPYPMLRCIEKYILILVNKLHKFLRRFDEYFGLYDLYKFREFLFVS